MTTNDTVTWLGKTRQQTYRQVANKNDNNCTVCIKLGCVWCSSSSSSSSSQSTGYCYNGDTEDDNPCNNDNDVPIDSETACNNDVSLVVFLITIFLGIVLPILLLCSCFSCIVYFARRYIKSRQYEQRIVPVEAEAEACSNTDHHIMYTFVVDDITNNNNNNNNSHVNNSHVNSNSSNVNTTTTQTAVAYEYPDNDDRVGTVVTATAVAIPMNR